MTLLFNWPFRHLYLVNVVSLRKHGYLAISGLINLTKFVATIEELSMHNHLSCVVLCVE
jgi:hypothetical protein